MENSQQEADRYIKHYNEMEKMKEETLSKITPLQIINIDHKRRLYMELSGFSLLIIAAVLQVLSSDTQTIITCESQAKFGIILLSFSTITTILYFTFIIMNEDKKLTNKKIFYIKTVETQINKLLDFALLHKPFSEYYKEYLKDGRQNSEKEEKMNIPNKIIENNFINWAISICFILGFLLVGISIYK